MIYELVSSWGPKQFPHKDKDFVPITHMNLKQTHRCQLLRDHNMVNGLFIHSKKCWVVLTQFWVKYVQTQNVGLKM